MSLNTILATTPLTSTNYVLKATGTTIGNSLIWDNGTNVGIGTTSAGLNLSVQGLYGLPATSGVQTFGIFRVQDSSSNIALDMGVVQNVATWIQSGNKANSAVLPLILNPSGGNVGIGKTPSDKLDVSGVIRASNTTDTNYYGTLSNPDGLTRLATFGGGSSLVFEVTGSEKMRITAAGNVGIGTSTPSAALQVSAIPSTNGDSVYQIVTFDTNTATSRVGAGISFGGYYNGTTDTTTAFASIKGFKENLTNNDYAGALAFMTRVNGGNSTERMRITSVGSIQYSVAYSSGYHMDTTPSQIAVANGGTINFANFSGMVVMNNHSSGGVTIYLMGAGLTTAVASNGTQVGTMAYNGAISGYTWTNNSGGTNIFGAAIIRTRTTA